MSETTAHKRVIVGRVTKSAGEKSITVLVERRVRHIKYKKFVKRFKRYIVHDAEGSAKVGDLVEAIECKPLSKRKSFTLKRVVESGVGR